jgi:PAS domain S-box-containing protein
MSAAKPFTNPELHAAEAAMFGESHNSHTAQFYSEDGFLVDSLSRFIGGPLSGGHGAVVIATEPHRLALDERLRRNGVDTAAAVSEGRYAAVDAAETLSRFMSGDRPAAQLFEETIGEIIDRTRQAAGGEKQRVVAFGEMVALLWAEGKAEAALELERLWNNLADRRRFHLRCAYPMRGFDRPEHAASFLKICGEHTEVIPAEGYSMTVPENERQRTLFTLQQKAEALDGEVAQRREIEKKLTMLAAIVECSEDGIASKDLNGIVTSWNAAAERIFGYGADEIVGHPIKLIIPPELHADEDRILAKLRRGERIEHFETVRLRKDGRRIHVSLTVSPVKDSSGTIIGAAKVVRDITDRKRTEEALRRAEKLAATGQLAATIAHEINNPMQALSNLLSLISYTAALEDNSRQLLAMANGELSRMSHITRQMLSFYRESSTPTPVKMTAVLDDVLELFAARLRSHGVKLERRYECDLEIQGFPVELGQLFANLVGNAIEAVGEKGRIAIHIAAHSGDTPEKQGVRVVIADTGAGIKREVRKQIFEPFFTTKASKGTGLGLWVVHGIVAKHKGSIRMRSRTTPGKSGTVFSVFLPARANFDEPGADTAQNRQALI